MQLFSLEHDPYSPALIDPDKEKIVSYGELKETSNKFAAEFPAEKSFFFLFCRNQIPFITAYIGLINAGHTVCLLDDKLDTDLKTHLIRVWKPSFIISGMDSPAESYTSKPSLLENLYIQSCDEKSSLHPDLSLLLSSSGSTGSPKLIRLSKKNILSNTVSIVKDLALTYVDRAMWALPFHYSFGLSILHTHLWAGGTLIVDEKSVLEELFWTNMKKWNATSLSGVPFTFEMLEKLEFAKINLPTLKVLTQAGGKMSRERILYFDEVMKVHDGKLVVMYGQTEATARISILPAYDLPQKAGSIGRAIPGGSLRIMEGVKEITTPHVQGELVYQGDNVMMGYAEQPEDLARDDDLQGILRTGDSGYFDEAHFFTLTGRLKRISKIYGLRIQLDDIEKAFNVPVAVTEKEDIIVVHYEKEQTDKVKQEVDKLAKKLKLPIYIFELKEVAKLPRTASGKIEYHAL